MKIAVDQIPQDGLSIPVDRGSDWARLAAEVALEGPAVALRGALELRRWERDVAVSGALFAAVSRTCDRCGGALVLELDEPLSLTYVPSLRGSTGSRQLAPGELSLGLYQDGALDLALVIQEHLALHLPWRVTCEIPGARLAGEPCTPALVPSPERTPDPRWAALAGLTIDDSSDK